MAITLTIEIISLRHAGSLCFFFIVIYEALLFRFTPFPIVDSVASLDALIRFKLGFTILTQSFYDPIIKNDTHLENYESIARDLHSDTINRNISSLST